MGFLVPLYIAGLAAIALPLVFHLIRRTPRGQTPFSSLMFLTPSPPRITRRSRLDPLLLLLLRALAHGHHSGRTGGDPRRHQRQHAASGLVESGERASPRDRERVEAG
jgi:hypothetical protein